MSIKGIDVSYWQGTIDWAKVKAAGVRFAVIREGYRKTIDEKLPELLSCFERSSFCIRNYLLF